MGGKPSKGTPADRRLKANSGGSGGSSSRGSRGSRGRSAVGKPAGASPMKPAMTAKPMAAPRRGPSKHS